MSLLSVSAAAKQWKVSRSWLYSLRDKGRLSFSAFPDGRPGIDTAELLRVLGEPKGQTAADAPLHDWTGPEAGQTATESPRGAVLSSVQAQLEALQQALAESKDRERQAQDREAKLWAQLEATQAQLSSQTKLLEHQTPSGGLWAFLTKPRRLW